MQLEQGAFTEPNARATLVPLYEGLNGSGQNAWPNVNRDLLGSLDLFHRFFPASFYYKTMIWPSWHLYEGIVRRLAGLGKSPVEADPQQYHKRNRHCDVLICGAGPAGLAAALAAGRSGLRVILIDEQEAFGGSLLGDNSQIDGQPTVDWVEKTVAELEALPEVTLLRRTTVTGYYDHNFLAAVERVNNHRGPRADQAQPRERLWRLRAKQVVLATGAIERPLVFANNDRPGLMLAGAVRTYLNRFGVAAGQAVAVVTNNDSAYRTALDLHDAGEKVVAIIDTRNTAEGDYQQAVAERGIPLYRGYSVKKVHGRRAVKGVTLARHVGGGVIGETGPRLNCDVLAMSGGWTPTIHLYSQAGGSLDYDEKNICLVPRHNCAQAVQVAGAADGDFSLRACLEAGYRSGAQAASLVLESEVAAPVAEVVEELSEQPTQAYWYTKGVPTDKQWLDHLYDVKVSDIEVASRENFLSVEHVKRFTTNGMSVDQGKTSNVNTLAVMGEVTGRKIPQVGTTKFRPPFQPATLGTFAGRSLDKFYRPIMETPLHSWHVANGAKMKDYGIQRSAYYPRSGETEAQAICREVKQVRESVGVFDSSTLGKLEVKGPDAATFLHRIYANNILSLKVGYGRYGLMLNENGVVIDDGVVVRLAEDHYLLHTTSAGATSVGLMLEEWQAEWPHLQVLVTNVTTQWANITVGGPKARAVMQALESDIDFSAEAFPHMQMRVGSIGDVPVRVLRASFTGETSYEINVPARYGVSLWEAVMAAGKPQGIAPYGAESMNVMRTEKGHLIIGVDTDGTTNPLDIGWGGVLAKKQDDYIGRRSLSRPADARTDRQQYIGLKARDPQQELPVGGHIIDTPTPSMPMKSQGYVTSSCLSPTLGTSIGVGLVAGGRDRVGEDVYVYSNGEVIAATLTSTTHYDAKGERLRA